MDSTLLSFGIDRTWYHGDDLEGTSILQLFQNSNKIFNKITEVKHNTRKKKTRQIYLLHTTQFKKWFHMDIIEDVS